MFGRPFRRPLRLCDILFEPLSCFAVGEVHDEETRSCRQAPSLGPCACKTAGHLLCEGLSMYNHRCQFTGTSMNRDRDTPQIYIGAVLQGIGLPPRYHAASRADYPPCSFPVCIWTNDSLLCPPDPQTGNGDELAFCFRPRRLHRELGCPGPCACGRSSSPPYEIERC